MWNQLRNRKYRLIEKIKNWCEAILCKKYKHNVTKCKLDCQQGLFDWTDIYRGNDEDHVQIIHKWVHEFIYGVSAVCAWRFF